MNVRALEDGLGTLLKFRLNLDLVDVRTIIIYISCCEVVTKHTFRVYFS